MQYRLYLMSGPGPFSIRAAESFVAGDDEHAVGIAAAVWHASTDVFDGCEVWRGTEMVRRLSTHGLPIDSDARPVLDARLQAVARQEETAALENRLIRSFRCVRESRHLLDRCSELLGDR